MTRQIRRALVLGTAVAAVLAAAGCAASPDASSTDSAAVTELKVGVTPIANAATVYLAEELGYFDAEGLNVTPTVIQAAAAAIPSLLNNELQFALISPVPTITAASKGLGVQVVAANDRYGSGADYQDGAALVAAAAGVSDVTDLAGKTIAVVGLKSAPELATRLALQEAGVDPSTVQFVEIAYPDMVSALQSSRVDAAVVVDPFLSQAKSAGLTVLSQPFIDGMPDQVGTTWVTSSAFASQNPAAVDGFVAAVTEATAYAAQNPDAVREIMGSYTELSPEALQRTLLPRYSAEIDADDLQWIADAMQEQGFIGERFDAAEVLWQR